ncbi:hypothetical protein Tco_0111262 [Tanacetum coccineum]
MIVYGVLWQEWTSDFSRSDEELGNLFFEGDCSSSNELVFMGVAGDDYEGAPVFDDGYEEAPIFDDDQFEEESMPVYDTDIEDVIGEDRRKHGRYCSSRSSHYKEREFDARDTNLDATSTRDE